MKVLMIDSAVGNQYAINLCKALSSENVKVSLITVEDIKDQQYPFDFFPLSPSKKKQQSRFLKPIKYFIYLFRLIKFINNANFDAVHFQFLRRVRIECLIFPILKHVHSNIVFTAHNIVPHENTFIDYWLRSLVYKNVDKIVVHKAFIKEKLLSNFAVNPSKIFVVPHINPQSNESQDYVKKEIARQRFNFHAEDVVILFFGYIRPYKGVDLLLDAFNNLKQQLNDRSKFKLIIAGKPMNQSMEENLRQIIHQFSNSIQEDIKVFFEFIPDEEIEYFFRAADIVALPYRHIDYSAVLDMASLYGRPILATPVGDFKTDVADQEIGFISEHITLDSFINTMSIAISSTLILEQMGQKSRDLFLARNSYPKIASKTIDAYMHEMP